MNRVTRKLVSLLGIIAVLFAQLAVSAYACPMQFMALDEAAAVAAPDANSGGQDLTSPALCQKHCENGQQIVNDTPQPLAAFSAAQALVVALIVDPPAPQSAIDLAPSLLHATSPPLSIRHCCFRI
jgi:hypothetical protein